MSVSRVKTWSSGEILTAADLNAEYDNILNNGTAVAFPLSASGSAAGFDITELDELAFATTAATVASAVGRLRRNGNLLSWHDGTGGTYLMPVANGYLAGLGLSNSGSDATNDIIIATGAAVDSTNTTLMRLTTSLAKQLDAAWAVGTNAGWLDTGAIANTTYHVHLIQRTDTGVVDSIASTTASAPVFPTNYTLSRRIGSIIRASAAILPFTQDDDLFQLNTAVLDVTAANETTAAILRTLTVPLGINVLAQGNIEIVTSAVGAFLNVSDPATTDMAASGTTAPLATIGLSNDQQASVQFECRTNTSGQIRTRRTTTGAGQITRVATWGWKDRRGRAG